MKCLATFLIILSLSCILNSISSTSTTTTKISTTEKTTASSWVEKKITFRNFKLKIHHHFKINPKNINSLLSLVDKRCDSSKGKPKKYIGGIRKNDIIVVTKKLLLWFSATKKADGRIVKSGGGLLAGVWELNYNKKTRKVNFKFAKNKKNFQRNFLIPCANPKKYDYGARIYGGYPAAKIKWTLEATSKLIKSKKSGKDIISLGKGAYSADEGIYIEFKGIVTNTGMESGFESITDTDPRPGVKGITNYTLVYRIPANRPEIIQEIEFNVMSNNFGPITTPIISLKVPFPNKGNKNMNQITYASNPELMPKEKDVSLKNVQINKFFRNTCVKKVYFYKINSLIKLAKKLKNKKKKSKKAKKAAKKARKVRTVTTPAGRGKILCIGNPSLKMSFLCSYPNNDYIPKDFYDEYSLQIKNNQKKSSMKYYEMIYKLSGKKDKTVTFTRGKKLIMVMRYKLIDASAAVKNKKKKSKKSKK